MNDTTARSTPSSTSAPFDTWAVLDFWLRRWHWLTAWTILLGLAGAYIATLAFKKSYTASAQLIHYAPTAADDTYHPRDIAAPSLIVMLQSPELFEKVGSEQKPAITAKQLARRLSITLDRNNDVASVTATGSDRDATVGLVNDFSKAVISYTQGMQKQEATEATSSIKQQLAAVEKELADARAQVPPESAGTVAAMSKIDATDTDPAPAMPSDLPQRLQTARDQLDELRLKYTDIHPDVVAAQARVNSLEEAAKRAAAAAAKNPAKARTSATQAAPSLAMMGRATPEEVAMSERLRSLEANRATLISRQRAIEPFLNAPPGYFSVLMPAAPVRTLEERHRLEMLLCGLLGAFFGFVGSAGQILFSEFVDNRLKTRADVRRVTGLPLLATLGDLKRLSQSEQDQWAFRAWTALQSRLSLTPNHGMVCGITSAHSGDGRSTWVELLARAASACGFRVLTITAQPSPAIAAELARREKLPVPPVPPPEAESSDKTLAINSNVLTSPAQISERLSGTDATPMVKIPLPGWVWNLDRRKQWQTALDVWRNIENVVIFVELPPASVSETVLLAENVPNLLWLVDSNKSDAAETHNELETLRHARCNLVGAVLNRERSMPLRGRFSRWLGATAFVALFGALLLSTPTPAMAGPAIVGNDAETGVTPAPAEPPAASGSFSQTDASKRAAWQQKLTLGPGDVLSFHIFGSPELTREEVPIGPDGRVSYLEAEGVMAAGLTVDELRDRLNSELGKFRRAPQCYVTPVAYKSKKYYMLGTVMLKGTYTLDRPTTVIEAVARARGFESGMAAGEVTSNTDFAHGFIARDGKRLPVDLDALFVRGDLSQNVALEPDDYLYFPPGGSGQVYVLGEVQSPGAAPCNADSNVISVVSARGGFTQKAWSRRVLVIRGSLDHPQTFRVDIGNALAGEAANVALQPGDLIYVSARPWWRAEDLLDRAASAWVESAVITWTGIHASPGGSVISTP